MKNLFTKILMLLFIISLSSCGMSKLISVDRGENTINYYNSIDKTIFLDFIKAKIQMAKVYLKKLKCL